MQRFYLGTHIPSWLGTVAVPLFVSRRVLFKRKSFPRANTIWSLDSGGFTELNMYGRWQTTSKQYVSDVKRFSMEIGNLQWAAPQDWMCEPGVLKKTKLSIFEHQKRTTDNFIELMLHDPTLPWIPVLQGWSVDDYLRHVELYTDRGVALPLFNTVAVGSVCRRSHTHEAGLIFSTLAALKLPLHGFGLKVTAMQQYKKHVVSSDSLAWSFGARYNPPLTGHTHKNCANCLEYALQWYNKIQKIIKDDSNETQINRNSSTDIICDSDFCG